MGSRHAPEVQPTDLCRWRPHILINSQVDNDHLATSQFDISQRVPPESPQFPGKSKFDGGVTVEKQVHNVNDAQGSCQYEGVCPNLSARRTIFCVDSIT